MDEIACAWILRPNPAPADLRKRKDSNDGLDSGSLYAVGAVFMQARLATGHDEYVILSILFWLRED